MVVSKKDVKKRIKKETLRVSLLLFYLSSWFVCLAFLSNEVFKGSSGLHIGYGFALIKALFVTKFMILGQSLFPFDLQGKHKLIVLIFLRSIVYAIFVMFLSILEKGLESKLQGESFIHSILSFCVKYPLHIVAWSCVYWLLTVPYLTLEGLRDTLGLEVIKKALYSRR